MNAERIQEFAYQVVARTWMEVIDVYVMMDILMQQMEASARIRMSVLRQACVIMASVLIWMDHSSVFVNLVTNWLHLEKLVLVRFYLNSLNKSCQNLK